MKWTTANVKNPNYTNNHEIYVGTQTGTFKKLIPFHTDNPFKQTNLQNLDELDNTSHITALAFGNEQKSEILVGRMKSFVQVHSVDTDHTQYTIDFGETPVVGLARFNDRVVAGFGNGHIKCIVVNEEGDIDHDQPAVYLNTVGDDMAHLRQCPTDRNFVAVGGKGRQNNLKVFNMTAEGKQQVFSSKNLPNDYLQLEVPVWDSDVGFLDAPHSLATCSRQGYVRLYDTRKQRRPVQCYATEDHMSFTTLAANGNYIYTGTTMGALKAFDIRRMKTFVHTYKGFTGGITDVCLDASGKYLTSACLDRYVRVHHVDSCFLMYQCYVQSKASRVLLRESQENQNNAGNDTEVENSEGAELSKKAKTQKNKRGQDELSEDEEYEDMFENMQTICDEEKVEAEDSNSEEETQAEAEADAELEKPKTLDTEAVADKAALKRKSNSKSGKNKRQKKGNKLVN